MTLFIIKCKKGIFEFLTFKSGLLKSLTFAGVAAHQRALTLLRPHKVDQPALERAYWAAVPLLGATPACPCDSRIHCTTAAVEQDTHPTPPHACK